MKPVNRYISLLLICGLMLPLYDKHTYNNIGMTNNAPACRGQTDPVKDLVAKQMKVAFPFLRMLCPI